MKCLFDQCPNNWPSLNVNCCPYPRFLLQQDSRSVIKSSFQWDLHDNHESGNLRFEKWYLRYLHWWRWPSDDVKEDNLDPTKDIWLVNNSCWLQTAIDIWLTFKDKIRWKLQLMFTIESFETLQSSPPSLGTVIFVWVKISLSDCHILMTF